jgi:phage gp45-like
LAAAPIGSSAIGFEHKDHRPKNLPVGGTALYDATGKILKIVKDEINYRRRRQAARDS